MNFDAIVKMGEQIQQDNLDAYDQDKITIEQLRSTLLGKYGFYKVQMRHHTDMPPAIKAKMNRMQQNAHEEIRKRIKCQ